MGLVKVGCNLYVTLSKRLAGISSPPGPRTKMRMDHSRIGNPSFAATFSLDIGKAVSSFFQITAIIRARESKRVEKIVNIQNCLMRHKLHFPSYLGVAKALLAPRSVSSLVSPSNRVCAENDRVCASLLSALLSTVLHFPARVGKETRGGKKRTHLCHCEDARSNEKFKGDRIR